MAKKKKRTTKKKRRSPAKSSTRSAGLSRLSLSQLQREMDRRAAGVARLEKRRAKLLDELAQVEHEIAQAGGVITRGGARVAGVTRRGTPRKRPKNATNLVEALHRTLKGRTLSVTDVAEAVQKGGYKTTSPNFRTIVNQALITHKKLFRKISRGKYTSK